jgi:hypothetical protein
VHSAIFHELAFEILDNSARCFYFESRSRLTGAASDRIDSGHMRYLIRLSSLLGVLQNDTAPMIIDNPPFLNLLQGSIAAEAGKFIVQAAISYARGFSGAVDITH